MDIVLRSVLLVCSIIAFLLCMIKIKQAKLKVSNSVVWMIACIVLILISIFFEPVVWLSYKLGFIAPVNFVFLVIIGFLAIQTFIDNIRIATLNEKIKDLDHYIALKEYEAEKNETGDE